MLDDETISQQIALLEIQRRNLGHLLRQAALYGGEITAPLAVANGVYEARASISKIKIALRAAGMTVGDQSADEPDDLPAPPRPEARVVPGQNTFNISGAIQAGIANVGGTMSFDKPINLKVGDQGAAPSLAQTGKPELRLEGVMATIQQLPTISRDQQGALLQCISQLSAILASSAPTASVEVSRVVRGLESLLDAAQDADKDMLSFSAVSLTRAAQSLGDLYPSVPTIMAQIIDTIVTSAQ
jgi:hypothetical protein